jgi:5-methylcytosine-specific restriction protein A
MQLFFHDVGLKGATRDFPQTVFGSVSISTVEKHAPKELKAEMVSTLRQLFPDGQFNVWGVPAGAASVINRLNTGDVMLLIRTTGGDGDIPALCIVKAYWRHEMFDLSTALWGDAHFPYIFFFDTEPIFLTWKQFKEDVGYAINFRPSGQVYRVNQDRLSKFVDARGYLTYLLAGKYIDTEKLISQLPVLPEPTADTEYFEGKRLTRERSYFYRNAQLVKQAKDAYGYTCWVCKFNFEEKYGELGTNYIECHHLNPLSERDDVEALQATTIEEVGMVCSNCHRMLHRRRPALTIEQLKLFLQEPK